jgi:hypothetical protein
MRTTICNNTRSWSECSIPSIITNAVLCCSRPRGQAEFGLIGSSCRFNHPFEAGAAKRNGSIAEYSIPAADVPAHTSRSQCAVPVGSVAEKQHSTSKSCCHYPAPTQDSSDQPAGPRDHACLTFSFLFSVPGSLRTDVRRLMRHFNSYLFVA